MPPYDRMLGFKGQSMGGPNTRRVAAFTTAAINLNPGAIGSTQATSNGSVAAPFSGLVDVYLIAPGGGNNTTLGGGGGGEAVWGTFPVSAGDVVAYSVPQSINNLSTIADSTVSINGAEVARAKPGVASGTSAGGAGGSGGYPNSRPGGAGGAGGVAGSPGTQGGAGGATGTGGTGGGGGSGGFRDLHTFVEGAFSWLAGPNGMQGNAPVTQTVGAGAGGDTAGSRFGGAAFLQLIFRER